MPMRCFRKTRVLPLNCWSEGAPVTLEGGHCWAGVCRFSRNKTTQIGLLSISVWRGVSYSLAVNDSMESGVYVVCVLHAVRLVNTKLKDKDTKEKKESLSSQNHQRWNYWLLASLCGFKTQHMWWIKTPVWKLGSAPLRWVVRLWSRVRASATPQMNYLHVVCTPVTLNKCLLFSDLSPPL